MRFFFYLSLKKLENQKAHMIMENNSPIPAIITFPIISFSRTPKRSDPQIPRTTGDSSTRELRRIHYNKILELLHLYQKICFGYYPERQKKCRLFADGKQLNSQQINRHRCQKALFLIPLFDLYLYKILLFCL